MREMVGGEGEGKEQGERIFKVVVCEGSGEERSGWRVFVLALLVVVKYGQSFIYK